MRDRHGRGEGVLREAGAEPPARPAKVQLQGGRGSLSQMRQGPRAEVPVALATRRPRGPALAGRRRSLCRSWSKTGGGERVAERENQCPI